MQKKETVILLLLSVFSVLIIAMRLVCSTGGRSDPALRPQEETHGPAVPLVHVVKKGETLGLISQMYYGTSAGWPDILEANKEILETPEKLKPDMVLIIPRPKESVPPAGRIIPPAQ